MAINYVWNCFGVWQRTENKDATYLEKWENMTLKRSFLSLNNTQAKKKYQR